MENKKVQLSSAYGCFGKPNTHMQNDNEVLKFGIVKKLIAPNEKVTIYKDFIVCSTNIIYYGKFEKFRTTDKSLDDYKVFQIVPSMNGLSIVLRGDE